MPFSQSDLVAIAGIMRSLEKMQDEHKAIHAALEDILERNIDLNDPNCPACPDPDSEADRAA